MHKFIEINKLHKTYTIDKKSIPVLQGLSLTVDQGSMLSITGVSGVGKSTFLQVLGTLDHPSSGEIYIQGRNLFKMSSKELALFRNQTIGFVYQFHYLLSEFTALENVMLPCFIAGISESGARKRASEVLSEVGLGQRFKHRPGELSGGEQQRVAIARSLVMSPLLVLADEPTGNLDRQTAKGVEDLMLSLNQKKNTTFVLATHNEELANRLERRLRLNDGIFEEY